MNIRNRINIINTVCHIFWQHGVHIGIRINRKYILHRRMRKKMRKNWSRTARRNGRRMTSTPRTPVTRRCSAAGPAPGAREAPARPLLARPRPPPPNPGPPLLNRNWNASVKGILIVAYLSFDSNHFFLFFTFLNSDPPRAVSLIYTSFYNFSESGSARSRVSHLCSLF
jgi:hypothetical protein